MSDLEDIIVSSIEDAELPPDPLPEVTTDEPIETTPEVEVSPEVAPEVTEATPEPLPTEQVKSPAAKAEEVKVSPEDFDKKYGLTPTSSSGRENRIPYSRVQKIVGKATKDTEASIRKEYEPKLTQLTDYETKVKDYEGRLTKVAQFENVMLNKQDEFLDMLAGLPAYKPFFAKVAELLAKENQPAQTKTDPTTPAQDDMPEPDQEFPDGSKVYSKEGLRKLLDWNATHAENRAVAKVTEAFSKRFGPMETEWQQHNRVQTILPQVQRQISEARQWPQFNDNEPDIIKALNADRNLTLEGAYRQVVFPKLVNDRNRIRQEVLAEVKTAPRATSTTVRPSRPNPASESTGPKNLEDIIADSLQKLK